MKALGNYTFSSCRNLQKIYVTDDCKVNLSDLLISDSTKIGPLPETMVGGVRVWGLRSCKQVVIPEGTERIGNYWFYGCDIEDIIFPDSVREIGTWAFYKCNKLTSVAFPAGLRTVGDGAFSGCAGLERAVLNEGLERLGELRDNDNKCSSGIFKNTPIKYVVLPSTLKVLGDNTFQNCKKLSRVASR